MRIVASVLNGPMGRRLINIGHMLTGNFVNLGWARKNGDRW
jgi:hypothetical protein